MSVAHPYNDSRPVFSRSSVHVTFDDLNNLEIISDNNIQNLSISYNYNADSFASITYSKKDFTSANYDFIAQQLLSDNLFNSDFRAINSCEISIGAYSNAVAPTYGEIIKFRGSVTNISETSTSVTVHISNLFNNSIKNGEIKELDFISSEDLSNMFNLNRPLKLEDYYIYFEEACKYNNAFYYVDKEGNIKRTIINKDTIKDFLTGDPPKVPLDVLDNASISPIKDNLSSELPNVYDIVLYVKYKRYNTLVKSINLSSTLDIPSGLRSTFTTNNSDGSTTTLYKTYDRPVRISAIMNAIKEAGWLISSNVIKSEVVSNTLDLDGSIIYNPLLGDDIVSSSIKCYRQHEQDISFPIILRIIDSESIDITRKIVYKKIEKEYVYNSSKPSTLIDNISNYVDAYDWTGSTHMAYMNFLKNRAIYEMKGNNNNLFNRLCNYTINFINTVSSRNSDMGIDKLPPYPLRDEVWPINDALTLFSYNLLDCIKTPYGGVALIFNKSLNWSGLGDFKVTYNAKHIYIPDDNSDKDPMPELPPLPEIIPTSAPHDAAGSGLLNVNGSSADWANDDSWAFENDVTLKRYYNYYYNTSQLVENADPELTNTNYYLQSVYVNKKVDISTLPFQATTSQCRIKNDKVKSIYTKAITLPPLVLETFDINPPVI